MNNTKKQMIVDVFNKKLMEFIKDIIETFPDNNDFRTMRTKLRMIISTTEETPIQNFKKYVVNNYKDYIISKNEDFFLKMDLSNTHFSSFNYLKDLWKNTTDNTKNAMWKYMELLTKLSEKYE